MKINNIPGPGDLDEDRARMMLSPTDFQLWTRCGDLAIRCGVEFYWLWRAVQELRNAGYAIGDGRIVERAKRERARQKAYMEAVKRRRRKTDVEDQSDRAE